MQLGSVGRWKISADRLANVHNVVNGIGKAHAGTELHIIIDGPRIAFWRARTGELVAGLHVPPPGVKIIGFTKYSINFTSETEHPTSPEL